MKQYINTWTSTVVNISLLSLLLTCKNRDQENKNSLVSISPKKELSYVKNDTLQFTSLKDLISFFEKKINPIDVLKVAIHKRAGSNKDSFRDSLQFIDSSYYSLEKERNISIYKFLRTHENNSENFEGLKYLLIDWTISIASIDSIFNQFPDSLRNSITGKWLLSQIEKRKITESQNSFNLSILDHPFITTDGKTITLKEIFSTSKYIFLDFWASWCIPCRYENRVLIKEKSLFASRTDISIIAISLDDNKNKWLQAFRDDSLNYINISDLKGFESFVAKELKIKTIPYNILITREGKILANNLWGNRLTEFIRLLP